MAYPSLVENGDSIIARIRRPHLIPSPTFSYSSYRAAELSSFANDVAAFVDDFFAKQPFTEYQAYFNVHRVDVASAQSGADHPETGVFKATAFDARYNCASIQRLICVDVSKVFAVVDNSVDANQRDIVFVLVNDAEYGGSGGAVAVASTHALSSEIAIHEIGHSFGLLADEYTTGGCSTTSEPPEPNVTMQTARNQIKWNTGGGPPGGWIDPATPIPTTGSTPARPGLYEGAKYCTTGVFRPTHDSLMRSLERPFEQINEEQLVKRIYNFVGLIDAASPAQIEVQVGRGQNTTFSLTLLAPSTHALVVNWTLDGQNVGAGAAFNFDADRRDLGSYTLAAEVEDGTPKVRHDPAALLVEVRSWTVVVGPALTMPWLDLLLKD